MKISKLTFVAFGLISLAGCNSDQSNSTIQNNGENSQNAAQPIIEQLKNSATYSFNENGCDTGDRIYLSNEDLCLGLQLANNNNECALDSRRSLFASNCSGTFDETAASKEWNSGTGPQVTCFFSKKVGATMQDLEINPLLVKSQHSAAPRLVIHQEKNGDLYMLAHQNVENGQYHLQLRIEDGNGHILTQTEKSVVVGNTTSIAVQIIDKEISATCYGGAQQ